MHTLVRYLEICDGNMQEGSFRCDANVSIRPKGAAKFGTARSSRTSTRSASSRRRSTYEVARQIEILEGGGTVVQETRLYDADRNETRSMRSRKKPTTTATSRIRTCCRSRIDEAFIEAVRKTLPELPDEKAARFVREHGLVQYDADVLHREPRDLGDYYESGYHRLGR